MRNKTYARFHKFREGDFIETKNHVLFDVKGLIHPQNKVIAFPRYIPNSSGKRKRDGKSYQKYYSISKRYSILKQHYPQYLVHDPIFNTLLCEVPVIELYRHYQPTDGLNGLQKRNELDKIEKKALNLIKLLKTKMNISWNKIGISGSILVRLHTPSSDIDIIIYGVKTSREAQVVIKDLFEDKNSQIKPYSMNGLRQLFNFRSKDTYISFKDFIRTESRKIYQGKFIDKDFFIRFVKERNEIKGQYGDTIYKPEGNVKIKAEIKDDSEAIFTPCCYKITNLKILKGPKVRSIEEIASFRGRFCDQAKINEIVVAQGKLEKVQQEGKNDYFRLLLGNKPSDHMILI